MLLLFIVVFLLSAAFSSLKSQNLRFDHFAVQDGLAQSVILSIYQDSEGFLWFGTQSGLSQYNGYEFINYFTNPRDTTTIRNTWIYDIAEDKNGNLYLATKGGLNKLDKSTGRFTLIPHRDSESPVTDNFVYGVLADGNTLYLNTPPSLIIIDTEKETRETYTNDFEYEGALHDLGYPVIKSQDNKIWTASRSGLSSFDLKTKTFTRYTTDSPGNTSVSHNHITALYEDEAGNILIGTENGLDIFEIATGTINKLHDIRGKLSNNFIRAIIKDNHNKLWIATEGGGVNRLDVNPGYTVNRVNYYLSDRNFVSHDIVYSLLIDNSDNMWIGTLAGIDKTDLKKTGIKIIANTEDPLSYSILDNVIASVYIDKDNKLWIGNWGKGLNILTPGRDRKNIVHYRSEFTGKYSIPENHIHVIYEDAEGKVWIGTRDGVSIFDPATERFQSAASFFENETFNCFQATRVYCMTEDRYGRMWIGTGNGIYVLDIPGNELITFRSDSPPENRIGSNLVYSILEDSDGEIWIATSQGLNRFDPVRNKMNHYTNQPDNRNSLCNNFTISLFEDINRNLWIGTGSGLNRFSKQDSTFLYYSLADGLPSLIIYDIIADNKDHLWFSTGRGLASMDPDKAVGGNFEVVDQVRGLEFNIKAVFKSKEGEMFFGGMNGLISFYPDSLRKNEYVPPIRITSVEKENDGVLYSLGTYQEQLNLSYKDYSVTIEFAALDYTNPSKNRYEFQLKGLSDNWINLGNRRFVHFTNLPPGSYSFSVKGTNNDGIRNENPATLDIVISPPWWRSNYAFLAYAILLVFIIIFIIYLRERTLLREKRVLEEKVNNRTAEIQKQKTLAEESEQKLLSTINSLDDLVFVLDEKGNFQDFYNPKKRKTHFIFPDLHTGKHYKEINLPEDITSQIQQSYSVLKNEDKIWEFDHHFTDHNKLYWYNTKISPKRNPEGKLTGLVIVARDITDRKESEEKLARQKEELNELNITKDKFFSILAHDLKNPFTNLYSMGDLLIKNYDMLEEEEKLEALKKMHEASEFIYALLENLLTWSRSQRDKIEYNPSSFNLSNLVDINVNLNKIPAETKGIKIINELNEELFAYGDREMIATVIRNLLNNAVKFSNSGKSVRIYAGKMDSFYRLTVEDEGIGMSQEDLNKLFKLDVKFKSRGTAGEKGTGLGLVICKEFVEKNRGKIWCESEINKGTAFHFTVPVNER
jgi:PAS domain S-box-containing protein